MCCIADDDNDFQEIPPAEISPPPTQPSSPPVCGMSNGVHTNEDSYQQKIQLALLKNFSKLDLSRWVLILNKSGSIPRIACDPCET